MQNLKKFIKLPQLLLFLLGNAFVAYSYQGFVSANDFLSGGTYGLAGIITHFLAFIPFPLAVLALNLPCILWGWRELDKRFVILTAVALVLQVIFLQIFDGVVIYNNDLLLAAIFAGVFVGAGDSLVLRSGSGSSGVHLIAMVLRYKFGITISTVTTTINAVIILLSTGLFGIEKGLYTLILIFASGQTLHALLDGLSRKRTAFVVTSKGEEVGEAIMQGLGRGVTLLPAVGLYSHTETNLLLCVTNMLEIGRLKALVHNIDPRAFITVYDTTDFSGHFLRHNFLLDKEEDEAAAAPPVSAPPRPSVKKQTTAPAPPPSKARPKLKFKRPRLLRQGQGQQQPPPEPEAELDLARPQVFGPKRPGGENSLPKRPTPVEAINANPPLKRPTAAAIVNDTLPAKRPTATAASNEDPPPKRPSVDTLLESSEPEAIVNDIINNILHKNENNEGEIYNRDEDIS